MRWGQLHVILYPTCILQRWRVLEISWDLDVKHGISVPICQVVCQPHVKHERPPICSIAIHTCSGLQQMLMEAMASLPGKCMETTVMSLEEKGESAMREDFSKRENKTYENHE